GQPYYITDQPAKPVESSGVARGTLGSTLKLVRMGDRNDRPIGTNVREVAAWPRPRLTASGRLTARVNPTIHDAMLRIEDGGDGGAVYSRVGPGGQPWGSGVGNP